MFLNWIERRTLSTHVLRESDYQALVINIAISPEGGVRVTAAVFNAAEIEGKTAAEIMADGAGSLRLLSEHTSLSAAKNIGRDLAEKFLAGGTIAQYLLDVPRIG